MKFSLGMIFGLDKYAAALTFKAMKALVRWLCYDNIISGDLSVPYADKGRHIEFQTKEGTVELLSWIQVWVTLKFLFYFEEYSQYSLLGWVWGGGLWSKELVAAAELGQTRNCSQSGRLCFAFNLFNCWKLCLLWKSDESIPLELLFVRGQKKVFANQGSRRGSRMIGRDYLIVRLFSGSSDCRIISD